MAISTLQRNKRRNYLGWLAILSALALSAPVLIIASYGFTNAADVWLHLWHTVLIDYVRDSLLLMLGVAIGVLLLGVSTAWLTSRCEFPFRRVLSLLLLLPMAMPGYIIAYSYSGLLDFAGPVQTWIRNVSGLRYGQYWFPEIHSLGGAIVVLSLVLYPYVYLMTRAAFLSQSTSLMDVSRSLGRTPLNAFFTVILPMSRPAIVAGLSLALMETLADYGTVQFYGISTFTTGIFRTFYGFGDVAAASQLAAMLLGFVFLLIALEKYSRRRVGYFSSSEQASSDYRARLSLPLAAVSVLCCLLPVLFGFLLPAGVLLYWSLSSNEWHSADFFHIAGHSLMLAALAAFVAVLLALVMAYAIRQGKGRLLRFSVQTASLGYALPGTIIAIGVVIGFAWLDHHLVPVFESTFNIQFGLLFSGTLVALVFAYTVRFLAVSLGAVQSGLSAIKPSVDYSARLLGRRPVQILREIHLPLLRSTVLTAFLIVFVDVLKELPATLILRPFNFNTLAVRAYELASDERLMDAAPAALMIVLVGLIPVFLLNRSITKS
ncbi:MAG: iron ABC transporter permease [Reinekea sp.]